MMLKSPAELLEHYPEVGPRFSASADSRSGLGAETQRPLLARRLAVLPYSHAGGGRVEIADCEFEGTKVS